MNNQSITIPTQLGFLKKPFVQHALFWTVYFSFNWLRWGSFFDDYLYSFQSNLVEFPLHMTLVYFTVYYLMPKLLPQRIGWFIAALVLVTLFISYMKIIITFYAVTTDIYKEANRTDIGLFDFIYVADVFIGELYVVAVAISVKITIDWIRAQNRTNELEKVNLETELAFLKSQIQPHFFFNTLNNLYSLTLDKSEKAPYTVLKLSELMSYVIYDAKQKRVPLINEIQHIQNYLDLEMLRYGEKLEIDFEISGDIEGKIIPPVLLLPFIENSFKHGTKVDSDTIPITISLDVSDNILTFSTENLKPVLMDNGLEPQKHGVGMTNTKRRLNLVYGEKHQLDIVEDDEKYKIVLNIPIENHEH